MKLFGLEITRSKKAYIPPAMYPDAGRGGWSPLVHEPYTGAWQRNDEHYRSDSVLSNVIVFRCISLIAHDIAKMRIRLVEQDDNDIWTEVKDSPLWPVLRKPNGYQNRIQFFEYWLTSKLVWGNAYILKKRDLRNVVTELYILDPTYVRPLSSPAGDIFYELREDWLSDVGETLTVPATEIIHDRMNCIYHPICGLSPIYAAGLPAIESQRIQSHSEKFFANGANPGGMLTAPGTIPEETAKRLKADFQQKYSGANVGRTFVAGDGLKYEGFKINAVDAQLIEQLKWTSEAICAAFGVPGYKVGVGNVPSYNNIEALERQYYQDCLQILIESIELCLDEGLGLVDIIGKTYGTEFDLDDLLRMDTATMTESIAKAVGAGVMKPDEGRRRLNYGPVPGGDACYLQEQNYSLEALNKRDSLDNPFAAKNPPQAAVDAPAAAPAEAPPPKEFIFDPLQLRNAIAAKELARMTNAN